MNLSYFVAKFTVDFMKIKCILSNIYLMLHYHYVITGILSFSAVRSF